jgi:hypothetical protein
MGGEGEGEGEGEGGTGELRTQEFVTLFLSNVLRIVMYRAEPCWTALYRAPYSFTIKRSMAPWLHALSRFPKRSTASNPNLSTSPNGARTVGSDSVKQRALAKVRGARPKSHTQTQTQTADADTFPLRTRLPHLAIFNDYAEGWRAQEASLVRI